MNKIVTYIYTSNADNFSYVFFLYRVIYKMGNQQMHDGNRLSDPFWNGCEIYKLTDEFKKNMPKIHHKQTASSAYYAIYIPTIGVPLYMIHHARGNIYKLLLVSDKKMSSAQMILHIDNKSTLPEAELEYVDNQYNLENYKGNHGVEGIMLLIFDLLKYFKDHNFLIKIKCKDRDEVPIKYSKMNKITLVERALNIYIPISLISTYGKYMEINVNSNEYKELESYVHSIRGIKWEKFKQVGFEVGESHNEFYHNDTTLFDALKKSEHNDENYRRREQSFDDTKIHSSGSVKFVEAFYNYQDDHAGELIENIISKYNSVEKYITFDSLYRFFGGIESRIEKKISDPFWEGCEIYDVIPHVKKQTSSFIVYDLNDSVMNYEISIPNITHKMYLENINDVRYTLMMSSFNMSQACMSIYIKKYSDIMYISYINGGQCYDKYKGDRGLKGIMHLCFDLLVYFKNRGKNLKMTLEDAAKVPIKNSHVDKLLKLERALNPAIPPYNISIYDKYMKLDTSSAVYKKLETYVHEIRKLKWAPFSKNKSGAQCTSDTYPDDMPLFEALTRSEEEKTDNSGKMRFVDYFYSLHNVLSTNMMRKLNEHDSSINGAITYESLSRHFGDGVS